MNRVNICGIMYDNISIKELYNILLNNSNKKPVFIVTPNVDFIVRADKDKNFKKIINNADYSLCDSAIVYFISSFLKKKLKSKITGYDAMELLLKQANLNNSKIFLLGSRDDILNDAGQNIIIKYNNIKIAGKQNGYFDLNDSGNIVKEINRSSADYLFVGMGSPKQEIWVNKFKDKLNVKFVICVGGLFDIYSGKVKRAPQLFQNIGMEWFWRFLKEPRRLWRRYFIEDLPFFIIFFKQLLSKDKFNG